MTTIEGRERTHKLGDLIYRSEYKFICEERYLRMLECRVGLFCKMDPHALERGRYRVRSLYFDTPDDRFYWETRDGCDNRYKIRIRVYNESKDYISLERKSSLHGKKKKESIALTAENFQRLCTGISPVTFEENEKAYTEILADCIGMSLEPRLIMEYDRVPYVYPAGNVRITFDYGIRAIPSTDLFEPALPGVAILPTGIGILEVKYDDVLPGEIYQAVDAEGCLNRVSFSKYAQGREALGGEL